MGESQKLIKEYHWTYELMVIKHSKYNNYKIIWVSYLLYKAKSVTSLGSIANTELCSNQLK